MKLAKPMLALILIPVLVISSTSCNTDQILADLNLAIQIAVQIIPAVTAISPSDGAAIQHVSGIASAALQVIEQDYNAYEASKSTTDLQKLQAALDVLKNNLNAEIAAVRITNPTTVLKVTNWANLIYSVTDAILSAVEGMNSSSSTKSMRLSRPLPTPKSLRAAWSTNVCGGETNCVNLLK